MLKPHNLYFHVPFCVSKCNYCAFYSRACKNPDWEKYQNGIIGEIDFWYQKLGKIEVPTIFFGGGTPSLMPIKTFEKIIKNINEKFSVLNTCEITLESNPGTLDAQKLSDFKSFGVNRLSVGVQSLDDEILKFLGRIHNAKTALELLEYARKLGLNVSADFIYGLPNQSALDVKKLCEKINSLNLNHCSMYELSIEQNTPFAKMNLEMPENEIMAQMYETIDENLIMNRYEVSNYAMPGFECRHNQNIWDGEPYIGIGNGAAGRVLFNGTWFEQMGNGQKLEPMSLRERSVEKLMTGMRTIRGIKLTEDVQNVIDFEFIKNHPDLVAINPENRLTATKKGILILDELLVNLIDL
ncbi:MAG TPA: radical SAM family heme chaperone HemW [Alphaproteobacteria bacterium]|nr:radical SAM family heme chaperone HemW [Alphaproteobacteria bacterium]